MANDFSARAETSIKTFYDGLSAGFTVFNRFITVVPPEGGKVTSKKHVDLTGLGEFSQKSGTPTAATLKSAGTAYEAIPYDGRATVGWDQYAKNPGILNEIAQEMADGAIYTIGKPVWAALATPDTIAHPDQSMVGAGATPYLADVFSSPIAQQNLYTSALTASTLATAKGALAAYKNKNGMNLGYAQSKMWLICGQGNLQTGYDLAGRQAELSNGSSLEPSGAWGLSQERVVLNPVSTDTNDWVLLVERRNPFVLHVDVAPFYRVTRDPASGDIEIVSGLMVTLALKPSEAGFIFNKVA